jgi:hypothetical protein
LQQNRPLAGKRLDFSYNGPVIDEQFLKWDCFSEHISRHCRYFRDFWAQPSMTRSQLEEFSFVVGKIYDATLTLDEWPAALDAVCKLLKVKTAALASYDIFDRTPPWQLQVGYDPQWMQIYTEKYHALNPYMDDVAHLGAGECNYSSRRRTTRVCSSLNSTLAG